MRSGFQYIWEEIALPISYAADRERAEAILLGTAERHAGAIRDARRGRGWRRGGASSSTRRAWSRRFTTG